jgi:prepilin-type N-terminal cleavage/methylation domain-containing protein
MLSIQQNNKGVTLVELIVTMAVSSIVIGMVVLIISSGSRSYRMGQQEVDLQMQAQTVINQLEDVVIEAYWLEKKSNIMIDGTPDIAIDVTAYIIYSSEGISAVLFDRTLQMLYYVDGLVPSQIATLSTASYTKAANLMASYVTEFTMETDFSTLLTDQKTVLQIKLKNNASQYAIDKTIAFRNHAAPTPAPPVG